jgi:hypothetical protein
MRDYRNYLTTPIDLGGNFQKGYDTRKIRMAGETAATGNYRQAASEVMPYDPGAAKSYLGFADYEDTRTQREDDKRFTRELGGKIASGDRASLQSAATDAYRSGRLDVGAKLQGMVKQVDDDTLQQAQAAYAKMWAEMEFLDGLPPQQQQAEYQRIRNEYAEGGTDIRSLPPQWGPNVSRGLRARALGPLKAIELELEERRTGAAETNANSSARRADAAEVTAQAALARAERGASVSPRETFQQERTLRSEFISQDKPLLEAQRTLNTAGTYAKQVDPTSGRVAGPKEQIRVNDGVLLMTVARMAQGSGVLSDQDVTLITGSGLDTIIANAQGFVTGNGQLSDRQRAVLATILGRSGKNVASARSQLRNQYTGLASNYGLNPQAVINEQEMGDASAGASEEDDFIRDPNTGRLVPNPRKQR